MKSLIYYFSKRHLLANLIFVSTLIGAIGLWHQLGKEEYPEFAMDWLRVNIVYPGATAGDVELFITKPVEEKLKELTGIYEVNGSSSSGRASFRITIDINAPNDEELIRDIKDAVERADLPQEAEDPTYGRFTSAEKAIIDIGFYLKDKKLLDVPSRMALQQFALAFENRILSLPEISGVEKQGYLEPELHILVRPADLNKYDLSLQEVRNQIKAQHVRMPAGSMEDQGESEVTFLSELDTPKALEETIVRGGFEGQKIRLGQVASVKHGFKKSKSILKVQGREGIVFNVQKTSAVDILTAQKKVMEFVKQFQDSDPDSPIGIVTIDDESYDVRNRLSIIGWNGLLGFLLIIIILFIFLEFRSGIWVAAGLPFCLAFTAIVALLIGYTVNNMTLAGVIIVLGIVVDDAIIVAENISRLRRSGMPLSQAVVEGASAVMLPVVASVLTTCAAFIPLYFFSGRFGLFIKVIPAMVFVMLGASLLESALILPGHLHFAAKEKRLAKNGHWFFQYEKKYASFLERLLQHRWLVIVFFICLLFGAMFLYNSKMKFVMFPREESREITIRAIAPLETTRLEMAKYIEPLEDVFLADDHDVVMSSLSFVGQSRRGGEVRENEATIRVELKPPSDRNISLKKLLAIWEAKANQLDHFEEIRFMKSRWGSDSGSPIEFEVQQNNDNVRAEVVEAAKALLEIHPSISNVEIERPVTRNEIRFHLKRDEVFRLGINPRDVAADVRAYIEGEILYTLNKGDEEVDVRLTSETINKTDLERLLKLRSANTESYLVPYHSIVDIEEVKAPANIQRINFKRTTKIYADLRESSGTTPLEIASYLESDVFPKLMDMSPSTAFQFRGEIEDSRESQDDFRVAIVISLSIIFMLLALLYNSLSLPLLIGATIPFGVLGVIFAFFAHGMSHYGFFAVIGTLGMIGVVINDAIVMVSKLQQEVSPYQANGLGRTEIAQVSSTRLRAIVVTTLTTVAGLFPTAYGVVGYDAFLAEMMLAMGWGLIFCTMITLVLVPCLYSFYFDLFSWWGRRR